MIGDVAQAVTAYRARRDRLRAIAVAVAGHAAAAVSLREDVAANGRLVRDLKRRLRGAGVR